MQTTSSPTSTERSPWPRNGRALGVWLGVSVLLVVLAFGASTAADGGEARGDTLFRYEFALGSLVVYGVLLGVTWLGARPFGDVRAALGLRSFESRWIWITLGLTFLALVVSAALEPILRAGERQGLAPDEWREDRVAAFALNALVVVLLVPFAEELFYRGLGVSVLGFLGKWVAIVGTAAAFAFAHGLLVGLPALGFFGLALGWVRWQTESVWPGVVAHALYNGIGIAVAAYLALKADGEPSVLGFLL